MGEDGTLAGGVPGDVELSFHQLTRRRRQSEAARNMAVKLDELRHRRADEEKALTEQRERLQRAEIEQAEIEMRIEASVEAIRREVVRVSKRLVAHNEDTDVTYNRFGYDTAKWYAERDIHLLESGPIPDDPEKVSFHSLKAAMKAA